MSDSVDRTVTVPTGLADIGLPLAWPQKAATDNLFYYVDFTAWLADAYPQGGGVISSIVTTTITLGDSVLGIVGVPAASATTVSIELSGGTPGVLYEIQLQVQTTGPVVGTLAKTVTMSIACERLGSSSQSAGSGTAPGAVISLDANIIGGRAAFLGAGSQVQLTPGQLTQSLGDVVSAVYFADNAAQGTTGYYWTAADVPVTGGSVNLPALFGAAAAWSSANNRAVYFPSGVYAVGTQQMNISANGVTFIFDKDARVTWNYQNSGNAVFTVTGNHFTCVGGIWGPPADTYEDFFTSTLIQSPVVFGPTTGVADFSNFRTVSSGNWAGLQLVLAWQTSTTTLFQAGTNITYHDTLPVNPQTNTVFGSLAALQTYLNTFPVVVSQSNLYLCNIPSAAGAPTVAGGAAVTAVTIGGWSGYQVVHTPPVGTAAAILNTSAGAVPGQTRTALSSTGNAISETVALPAPTINFITGQPVFYQGGAFVIQGDDATFYRCEFRNASGTRMLLKNGGNRLKVFNCDMWASDSTAGSAYIRIAAGDGDQICFNRIYSGDETLQFVTSLLWIHNGPGPNSNKNITNGLYLGNLAVALGGGPCISASMKVNNNKQAYKWLSSATVAVGNVITFPDPIPTGVTAQQLQYSSQAWAPSTAYAIPVNVTSGTSQYALVTAGTSSATGNGPGGTGSHIVDGTCVWSYVAGSAGYADSIYSANLKNVAAGSLVIGYSHSGSTNTITYLPPAGTTNAIYNAITTPTYINFISGTPLGAMTNNVDCRYENNYCIGVGGNCLSFQNTDSVGSMRAVARGNFFDSSWVLAPLYSVTGRAVAFVQGDAYGGVSAYLDDNRFILPWSAGIWLNGTLNDFSITGNEIDGAQLGAATAYSQISVYGGNTTELANSGGVVADNVIWATQGSTLPVIVLGKQNTVDGMGEAIPGNTWNTVIERNRVYAIPNGVPAIQVAYGGNHTITKNTVYPAVLGGGDTAQFLQILSTSSGWVISDYNNLVSISGTPYSVVSGAALNNGQWEMYNPALGSSTPGANPPAFVAPVVRQSNISGLTSYTVQPFAGFMLFILNNHTGGASSNTIVLPTGSLEPQQIQFTTLSSIGTLSLTNGVWPASTGMAANTGITLVYQPSSQLWYPVTPP